LNLALYFKNSINVDNTIENQNFYLEQLKTLTLSSTSIFEEINGKFNFLIEDAKRRIEIINYSRDFKLISIFLIIK